MDFGLFLTFLAACGAAAATGIMFKPGEWYRSLDRPAWTPPDWMFPVVWTTLYLLIALAAARVAGLPGSGQAMAFWALQITLNTLWTPVFFGAHRIRAGLVILALLWLAVAATVLAFFRLDPIAGVLMLPYLAWLSVAAALNLSILRRNPGRG